jgi:hypothetical protein
MTLLPRGARVLERKGVAVVRCGVGNCRDRSDERLPALCKHMWRGTGVTDRAQQGWLGWRATKMDSTGANTPSRAAPAPRPSFITGLDLDSRFRFLAVVEHS